MPEDRSLDEFGESDAEAGSTEDLDETVETAPAETESDDGVVADAPTPATATATWTAGGADCERCGDRAERRWLDEGDRVCLDCKPW